uniref:Uncharacterized protein n=1 Tax=Kalanchoe fedtschenkoi TaxID=63787 RepID=A0A7N0RDY2_KALFE
MEGDEGVRRAWVGLKILSIKTLPKEVTGGGGRGRGQALLPAHPCPATAQPPHPHSPQPSHPSTNPSHRHPRCHLSPQAKRRRRGSLLGDLSGWISPDCEHRLGGLNPQPSRSSMSAVRSSSRSVNQARSRSASAAQPPSRRSGGCAAGPQIERLNPQQAPRSSRSATAASRPRLQLADPVRGVEVAPSRSGSSRSPEAAPHPSSGSRRTGLPCAGLSPEAVSAPGHQSLRPLRSAWRPCRLSQLLGLPSRCSVGFVPPRVRPRANPCRLFEP